MPFVSPSNRSDGYLELIFGPMFSGKTSYLLNLYRQYTLSSVKVLVINHSCDTRYSSTFMVNHDNQQVECVITDNIMSLMKSIHDYEVVLINEGQFFEDISDFTLACVEKYHKLVYVCGLDGDYKRELFGDMYKLMPYCDNIIKLHSICSSCKNGTQALFSHRLRISGQTFHDDQVLVGGTSEYRPLCRHCYLKATNVSS